MDLFKFVTLVGSVHFVDLLKFSTLVGSIHVVDWGLDPWWGPSTDGSNILVVITQQSLNVPP